MDFRFALRNLLKHRQHALLNISGLGVAMAACLIIFLVVRFEYSHNKQLKNYHSLNQIITSERNSEGENFSGGVPFPMMKQLHLDFPDLKFGQYMQSYGTQITIRSKEASLPAGQKFIEETGVYYADPELVELMELRFLQGSPALLNNPHSVVLSRKTAERYFGNWREAIGKTINHDNFKVDFAIAGVFEDNPDNSDFPFQIVAPFKAFEQNNNSGWPLESWGANTSAHQVFVHFPENKPMAPFAKDLKEFEKKHNTANSETRREHSLLPMAEIHFDTRFPTMSEHQASRSSLYSLSFIGLLILAMACINFINLATALSGSRSKEFGVRKVIGGSRQRLMLQSFTETGLLVSFSALLGLLLAWGILPYIKHVMPVQVLLPVFGPETFVFLVSVVLLVSLLAGIYPALVLSGFSPIEALRSRVFKGKASLFSLRRVLVVTQFAFSQVFIIATLIGVSQMNFIQNSDLGFTKEAVLLVSGSSNGNANRFKTLKNELAKRPDVEQVSICFDAPGSQNEWQSNFAFEKGEDKDFDMNLKFGDADFAKTFGLKLLAGRFYFPSDTVREFVVNETLLKKVGLKTPAEAIGKTLKLGGGKFKPICGVVKDFHAKSLKSEIPPIVISPNPEHMGTLAIKLKSKNLAKSNDEIKQVWDSIMPEYVFLSEFLDDSIQKFYIQEERISNMYKVYAFLAIFISSLGLYGLISYIVSQKTKEVGIRKVLRASVQSLVFLFSKEFTLLIGIAFLLAAPAGWYFMHLWLEDFVYRIRIGPGIFVFALLISGILAWLTIGFKSWQAAAASPVKSLKTE